ncbi:hypothetical protein ASH04_06990 [Rhodococcus sp. Leaf233]|nr:hypothetical protein ASH04_06990 [Rhodococcus sp. Leaf233]
MVRLHDGEWNLQFVVGNEYSGSFEKVDGDTGVGTLPLPTNSNEARWALDSWARIQRGEKRNIHITVDYVGDRWDGRLKNVSQDDLEDGTSVTTLTFASSYEELKYYDVWSSSFLPAIVQPRMFILPGPMIWVLKTTFFMQVFREHNPLITFPDEPMNLGSWFGSLDQSNWNIVVKPTSFIQDMAAGTIWGIATSRWKNFHAMAKPMMQDAEITPVLRRYLAGDEPPWPGANLRHGALVVDFVDKSGVYTGTSHGGTIFDGLIRTITGFASDFIDSTSALITNGEIPGDYFVPGRRATRTDKRLPFAVYLTGERSGVTSAKWVETPSTAIQVNTGGHSMPGVNEAISAGIQALGDILGNLAQIGSIGGSIDTILKPFYEDTILAWMSVKSFARAQDSGWSRYFEFFQEGAGKAYTISSLMVLRQGFWETRTYVAHELNVRDGGPFLIGDDGHISLGDRIGATRQYDYSGRIYMDRVSKTILSWSREAAVEYALAVGDDRALQDPGQRAWERIESLVSDVQQAGVF